MAALTVAACSGSSANTATTTPSGTPLAGGEVAPGTTDAGSSDPARPSAPSAMAPLVPTKHEAALAALGLNPADLPTMDKLTPEQTHKVMGLFTKSLGVDCKFCHKGGDFKAPTEHKKLAERMWDEWVHGTKLSAIGGGTQTPVFCDSCHQGKSELLDKQNHEELAKWMKSEFVDRLHKTSGAPMSCETCHGKPFDGDFLEKWEKL